MVKGDFTFYNVGQGLFYGGQIETENKKWSVVYDCGSLSSDCKDIILDNIDLYLSKYTNRSVIDLLMVSHFDEDHVNRLFNLLDKLNKKGCVHYLVMPYFTKRDIFVLAASMSYYEDELKETLGVEEFGQLRERIQLFMENPIRYLRSLCKIDKVILITTTEESDGNQMPKLKPVDENGISISLASGKADLPDFVADEDKTHVIIKSSNGMLYFCDKNKVYWYFKFFNDGNQVAQNERDNLYNNLKKLIGSGALSDLCNAFKKRSSRHGPSRRDFRKVYGCFVKKRKKKNNGTYEKVVLNDSTLAVFHAPKVSTFVNVRHMPFCRLRDAVQLMSLQQCSLHCYLLKAQRTKKNGTLLLGDIDLTTSNLVPVLAKHLLNFGNKASVCLVPHHGSQNNWDNSIFQHVPQPCEWVVSYGTHGRYGHPHRAVVRDFEQNSTQHHLFFCNEYTSIHIEMHS